MKRTIVHLNERALKRARILSGISDMSRLINHSLRMLIALEESSQRLAALGAKRALMAQTAARRLAALGGTMPNASAAPRRRMQKRA